MLQSFQTNRSRQTVQTQIRLLLEEQSDQGLHCLLFHLHLFEELPGSFLPFRTWGQGPLSLGKKKRANLSNWENLTESLKQYVNFLAFLLPAQQSISSFFFCKPYLLQLNRRRNRMQW